jgi:hypothetical protein
MSQKLPPPQTHHPNPTQTPTPNDQPSPTPSMNDPILQGLLAALAPVVEFHKTVDSASDNDLRMYWDVRLVQGKDTPFTSISGNSSFPGILVGSALGRLPEALSREVVEKIAVPLAARLQDMSNERAMQSLPQPANGAVITQKPAKPLTHAGSDLEIDTANLLPEDQRNDVIDAMLPKSVVEDAAGIISELKKSE